MSSLVDFTFKNFRSFYEEVSFSLEASADHTLDYVNAFEPEDNRLTNTKSLLLKSALLYGPNASGKSNFLKALNYMKQLVLRSNSDNKQPYIFKNEPFAFFKDAYLEDTSFEVRIIQNQNFYRYGFIINSGHIKKEYLYRTNKKEICLFERNNDDITIRGYSKNQARLINIPDNWLFLSFGFNFKSPVQENIRDVYNWFTDLLIVIGPAQNSLTTYETNPKSEKKALDILKKADTGISDMKVVRVKVGERGPNEFEDTISKVIAQKPRGEIAVDEKYLYDLDLVTQYPIFDNKENHKVVGQKNISLYSDQIGFNSEGTEKLILFLGSILDTLDRGGVIAIDEIDSRLHFLVSDYLISMFNSISSNPNNAQLIATAHNTMLMERNIRRDQIYFVSKDREFGISSFVSLSDFKNVRKNDLFSKNYLAGFYTKLPDFTREVK